MRAPVTVRPGAALAATAAAAVLLTSGCAAGRQAQTAEQLPSHDGTQARVGDIALRGLAIKSPSTGAGYAPGSSAPLIVVFINTGKTADRLTSVSSTSATGWSVVNGQSGGGALSSAGPGASYTPPSSAGASTPSAALTSPTAAGTGVPTPASGGSGGTAPVSVPPNTRVSYGVPDSTQSLLLTSVRTALRPGSLVPVTFSFARSGQLTVLVPVQLSATPNTAVLPGPSATGEQGGQDAG